MRNLPWFTFTRHSLYYMLPLLTLYMNIHSIHMHVIYIGYISLWKQVSNIVFLPRVGETTLTLCLGDEWYTMPSHFFVSDNIQLAFYEENFTGILPLYYQKKSGTRHVDTTPTATTSTTTNSNTNNNNNNTTDTTTVESITERRFNNMNLASTEQFIHIQTCDLIITSQPSKVLHEIRLESIKNDQQEINPDMIDEPVYITSTTIIDAYNSVNSIARAYYIPYYSDIYNRYKNYTLYSFVPVTPNEPEKKGKRARGKDKLKLKKEVGMKGDLFIEEEEEDEEVY